MKIHGDNVVAASRLEHVSHQLGGDRSTALVLLVLARIGEVRDDSCYAPGGGRLASVDHDKEFHESVVDIVGSCGLQNEYCKVARISARITKHMWGV